MEDKKIRDTKTPNSIKKERKQYVHEFSGIQFPSHKADRYRASLTSLANGVVIWLESKKTKQQWQATVTDVGECGPTGVPEEAVVAFMKKALELLIVDETAPVLDGKCSSDDPVVDFEVHDGEVTLVLNLSMGGIWKPQFVFTLLPVGLDKIDVLEAKLRDAQEEIEMLKSQAVEEQPVTFLSLSSQTACGNQQYVQWDRDLSLAAVDHKASTSFNMSADKRQITVLKAGTYQINVRLAGVNTANSQFLCLQMNGVDVAQCTQSDANGHQNTAQLFEIMKIPAQTVFQVRCGANSNSLNVPNANRFTILRLGC